MNDFEAMEAINAALDEYIAGDIEALKLIKRIAIISGTNQSAHEAARAAHQ